MSSIQPEQTLLHYRIVGKIGEGGMGHVYQGRYKSFPVQDDFHYLTVCRYVERNALRAKLVRRFPRHAGALADLLLG